MKNKAQVKIAARKSAMMYLITCARLFIPELV